LGGYIAWNYTLSYPQNVSKLILFNPAAFPTKKIPDALRIAGIPILRSLSLKFTPKYFTKKMANQVFNDKSKVTDEKIDRYHHMLMRAGNRKSYQNIFLEMLSKKDEQPQNLKKISSPTFLVWGEEDFWIPATQIKQWKQAIPHLISVSYPKVGHMPHEEIPKKTAHDVLSFLHGTFQ
jgi:pimeloyl-ACP methyl ester carboxylesterase